MIFDTHVHADFSCDAHQTFRQAIAAAEQAGIGMVLTEHWDYDYPTNPEAFLFDRDEYFRRNSPLRSEKVLLGIEVGMMPHLADRENAVPCDYPFDMVIGSMHCVHRQDLYFPETYKGETKDEAEESLIQESILCVKNHNNYDTFGHIDYICRYWPYDNSDLDYAAHKESYDELFRLLVEREKPLEINTRRLDGASAVTSLYPLYRRYHELGGRYCTLGSDAHYAEHVGRRLDVALAIAGEAGLIPVYFRERKLQIINI